MTDIGWNIKGKLASHVTMAYMLGQMPACSDRGQRDRTRELGKDASGRFIRPISNSWAGST